MSATYKISFELELNKPLLEHLTHHEEFVLLDQLSMAIIDHCHGHFEFPERNLELPLVPGSITISKED